MVRYSSEGGGKMRAILKWGIVSLVAVVILAVGGGWTWVKLREAARVATVNEFSNMLTAQGVEVQEIQKSVWETFFPGAPNKAAWIKTNLGVLNVVIFPGSHDADRMRVTQIEGDSGRFRYKVELKDWSRIIDSNAPELITARGHVFVITRDVALDTAVKQMLSNE